METLSGQNMDMDKKGKCVIQIPELSLIALVGVSGSGKSTFAKKHFKSTEVLSSDHCRAVVCDDENDQSVSKEAFELLYFAAAKRLALGRRTVIDATNVQAADRKKVIETAKAYDVHAVAIVLNIDDAELVKRSEERTDRRISHRVIKTQADNLKKSIKKLKKEGFRFVYVLEGSDIDEVQIEYTRLWSDKKDLHGPFDIIGDVHGCSGELRELLDKLGYEEKDGSYVHPDGRCAVFLGDLTDRGPDSMGTLKLVMDMVKKGSALCITGNHDNKLERYLGGRNVQVSHGMESTIKELEQADPDLVAEVRAFLEGLISHYVLDDGKLVVAHAGIKQEYIGRASGRIRAFCLYGDTTGETDDLGLPVRLDWAQEYRGRAVIVYGHVPRERVYALNNTYCIDTGCVFGGSLSALRYPEMETVSVKAHEEYYKPVRPLKETATDMNDALLASDVTGKLRIETALTGAITVREDQSAAAMEIMSRFSADPHWLIYLPPTMSPCETSSLPDHLEYPTEAFSYYRKNGVQKVVCEKKHMGSRCVVVLCRDEKTAGERFNVHTGDRGVVYTRTGRRFFQDKDTERGLLDRLKAALSESGFWEDFKTDWVCIDAELMPWSEKARDLIRTQYAPIGTAGRQTIAAKIDVVKTACERMGIPVDAGRIPGKDHEPFFDANDPVSGKVKPAGDGDADLAALLSDLYEQQRAMEGYVKAYREYCWDVNSIDDLVLAPFHLLATEGHVYSDKDHIWHMETVKKYCTLTDKMFMATPYLVVDVNDEVSVRAGVDWWLKLTGSGGEGMVVKPYDFVSYGGRGLLQPAVKCRGREYLRIIYGPEYLFEEHLKRLKVRSLSRKREMALKEFSLGMEALNRFVKKEPLSRIHQCVFGVLAFESEPVDPRL